MYQRGVTPSAAAIIALAIAPLASWRKKRAYIHHSVTRKPDVRRWYVCQQLAPYQASSMA